jgi:neurobeachin-like protein 1/2
VPPIKKWSGYGFTFHCWLKLNSDLELFEKKRRQLYSFYKDNGQGFEAFFTSDCSSLVVSVCTKKEFLSVQLRELDFDSSQTSSLNDDQSFNNSSSLGFSSSNNNNNNTTTNTNDFWHSVTIVHIPAKNPFSYSQVCIYIDGILKKETDLKCPNFHDSFNHNRIGATCARPQSQSSYTSTVTNTLTAPLSNLKNVFYKNTATEKVI